MSAHERLPGGTPNTEKPGSIMTPGQAQPPSSKTASPERWQKALQMALVERVRVFQVEATGQWIATSGTTPGKCYEIKQYGASLTCTCQAAEFGDPICKHRARWYWEHGVLDIDIWDVPEKLREQVEDALRG